MQHGRHTALFTKNSIGMGEKAAVPHGYVLFAADDYMVGEGDAHSREGALDLLRGGDIHP